MIYNKCPSVVYQITHNCGHYIKSHGWLFPVYVSYIQLTTVMGIHRCHLLITQPAYIMVRMDNNMELNGVNSYYTSYEAASNKKTAVKDTDNSTASKTQAMLQLLMSHLQTKAALQHHLLKVMLPIQHL